MGILCRLAGHKAAPSNIWNNGHFFSRCTICDCEMIGRGGSWRTIPRGYRVVWRPREESEQTRLSRLHMDGARISDLLPLAAADQGDTIDALTSESARYPRYGSVVESFHARAAAG
jgi:hypothetical protein